MKTLAAMRPTRRGPAAPSPTWLIVMVVPLAATCMLAFPVPQQHNPARVSDSTHNVDRAVASSDRDRRSGHSQREETDTHDPPHELSFWEEHASTDRDELVRPESAHSGAMLALDPLGEFPCEFRRPGDLTFGQHDSRGPPHVA